MSHVVLLGDSIFDNASYVPGGPAVIDQLRRALPSGWRATLLAVDGDMTAHVAEQLQGLPTDASHLVVSVGGNDALSARDILGAPATIVADALNRLGTMAEEFRTHYGRMLDTLRATGRPVTVCTVYDAVPGLGLAPRTALALFNDVILRSAFARGLSVIDLRLVCPNAEDYSELSPIEPSARGGDKIARRIAAVATTEVNSLGASIVHR